jgi:hypothetical protein
MSVSNAGTDRERFILATILRPKVNWSDLSILGAAIHHRYIHLVTAEEVRAMVGVLTIDGNVSKGFVTTTSDFDPGIAADPGIQRLMPARLELKPRDPLLAWLEDLWSKGR